MADEDYHKKLRDLQRYVPFLENTIKRLKTESGKPREAQISKLQSLLVILTNTKKKLKYDALKKCEEVILKLYEKVEKKPTSDSMHKYMCRNPPEDPKFVGGKGSTPTVDNETAFSVARQKLNKQAEMTPASPSPPLEEPIVAPKPVVIPTEKILPENGRAEDAFTFQPILNNEFNIQQQPHAYHDFADKPWTNFQENIPLNPQTINWPSTVFTQPLIPVMPHQIAQFPQETFFQPAQWPQTTITEPLYSRRNDVNHSLLPKYDIWKTQNLNFSTRKPNMQSRELIDYSDSFGVDNSPKIDEMSAPKPVPPPVVESLPKKEDQLKLNSAKKEPIKITFLPKPDPKIIAAPLNKPPLTESDLQDLLSSSDVSPNSEETSASPLVNEDMDLDKLEALKAKLCKELEESKKKDEPVKCSTASTQSVKAKGPRVIERVVKEQDNIFGSLLSSIDEQIMVKTKENYKKPDKKDSSKHHKRERSKDKDKSKTITKTDVTKLNEKVKNSYFKDAKPPKKEPKSKTDKDKPSKPSNSKTAMPIVDKIMKDLKESVKERKEESLTKFGDSVREMQEHMLKSDSNHSVESNSSKDSKDSKKSADDKLISGRLSDKYPHKRKPSLEKLEKPDGPKVDAFLPPKPIPAEAQPLKLADPRLKPPNVSPQSMSISPEKNYQYEGPPNNAFNYGPPCQNPHIFHNDQIIDQSSSNMGLVDPYSMGNQTPMDPFLNEPFPNMGGGTTPDPFSTNYDVDMRDPNHRMFPNNFGEQFWGRPNQEQYNPEFHNQRFQNYHRFPQYQNNFSPYDLSHMNPIDFYDNEGKEIEYQNNRDFNSAPSRPFRGRGGNNPPRGSFRGRGHNRNIQWVNPTIRDEPKPLLGRHPSFPIEEPKPLLGRHPSFPIEEPPKDPRRNRFSSDEPKPNNALDAKENHGRKSRFSSDEPKPNNALDPKENHGRKSRFSQIDHEEPKKHSKESTVSSKDSSKKKEEIFSPLNSLYSSETKQQIGKGYGIQKFKIPKIRRSIEEEKAKETVEAPIKVEDAKEPEKIVEIKTVEEPKNEEVLKVEDVKKLEEVEEVKVEAKEESGAEPSTSGEADDKLEMFNKFMKHIFDTCDSSVLLQYLDKCGFSLPQAKTKRIRRIIESDSESEDEDPKEEKPEEPEQEAFKEPPQKPPETKTSQEEFDHVLEDDEKDVIESVGERIKNRRRKQLVYSSDSSPEKALLKCDDSPGKAAPKTEVNEKKVAKTKRKNALELLQDDLREMFISKGVLTATGKRMCRMMKEHQESGLLSPAKPTNKDTSVATTDEDDDIPLARRKFAPKPPKKPLKPDESPKKQPLRKTRSSPRVLLEKINLPIHKTSSDSDPEVEDPNPEVINAKRFGSCDPALLGGAKVVTGKRKRRRRGRRARRGRQALKRREDIKTDTESIISEVPSKESDALDAVETLEESDKKRPMVKKKKNNWAHGVIRRGRRVKIAEKILASPSVTEISDQCDQLSINDELEEPSDNEEYALLKIDFKPDVNYYLDTGNKFDCKLCDYKGKLIVHHYRTRHPESENMISRLSPDQSEKAKIESKLNKFDAILPYEEFLKGKKRRTTYVCRFCTLTFKQEFTSSFFDHICCHTGEYRYSCDGCSFYTGVKKTLSAHCHNLHPEMKRPLNIVPLWPAPPNFRIVFGYLCKACNFTQLLKNNLDKHIKLSHPGVVIEVIKISMSSKPVSLDDLEELEEIEETSKKELDMAAFLEPDDIPLREQQIQDDRRKKMEEISNNITPRRPTLQFVDQLKSKLQSAFSKSQSSDDVDDIEDAENTKAADAVEEIEETDNIDIENHLVDTSELEEIIPEELNLKITSTCSLADYESSENEEKCSDEPDEDEDEDSQLEEMELHISDEELDMSSVELTSDSKQKGVLNTIQRLAAQLQTPSSLPDTSEVPPDTDLQDAEHTINVGAIEAIIRNTEQLYNCRAPNCTFTSLYKISFSKHCFDNHPKLLVNCELCLKEGLNLKPFTMSSLFVHLFDKHKENAKNTTDPPKIRLRRISGDLLSKPTVLEPLTEELTAVEPLLEALNQPIIFEPLPDTVKAPPLDFFQIKDVRTLTPEEENILEPSTSLQVTNVTTVTTVTTSTGKKLLQTKKILVPVKELPKFLTVKKGGNNVCYVNKKAVVFDNEVLNCNKTKKIFTEMLRYPKIMDLYKCPIELCSYSTNVKIDFSTHFTNHRWCQITSCIYCHEGISSNNIIPHIDKYHAHCTIQCGFCFYRSINKNYLLVHQVAAHGHSYDSLTPNTFNNTPKYYILKPGVNMSQYFNVNDFLVNSKQSMIQPYLCQQNACNLKFLIADDFMVHLHVFHKKYFSCALCKGSVSFMTANALITHYVKHLIGKYQCRFCLFGASYLAVMYNHYARKHPAMKPVCYHRQFLNKNLPHSTYEDIIEVDIEKKMYFEKSQSSETPNSPNLVPIPSPSPTISSDLPLSEPQPEPVIDQNFSSSFPEDLKPVIANLPAQKDLVQIPQTSTVIDVIDLSDDNPQNTVDNQLTNELNEPLVTLKHRSVESKNAVENAVDPLSVDCNFQNVTFDSLNFSELIPTANSEKTPVDESLVPTTAEKSLESDDFDRELSGDSLFMCGNSKCRFKTINISDFKIHLFTCDIMGDVGYKCVHCLASFNTVTELCEHILIHGVSRFSCELCSFKSPLSRLIVQHMKTKHTVDYTKFMPVESTKKDISKDKFVVRPMSKITKSNPGLPTDQLPVQTPDNAQLSPQKVTNNIFGPEDIELLPRPPVYSSQIKCKLCNYATKVRSNMQRHLQQHIDEKAVPETAPINPVPCLEKNEKMFDKMTNLAASSHYGRMGGKHVEKTDKNTKEDDGGYPGFVPASKRFVCGAENCNYLTHGDTMLRHHLTALHADESSYKCPHCHIDIPCDVDGLEIDQILFHIKMHDLHLYKCPNCNFLHYQKHKLEKHLLDIHSETGKNYQIIRELDNSANLDDSRPSMPVSLIDQGNNTESNGEFKPWRCGFCSYKSSNRTEVMNHASAVHNIKSQFKCGLCNYRCSAKNNYSGHFKRNHPNLEINMISVYYKVSEDEEPKTVSQEDFQEKQSFDTTPLWVKNKSGVKHIRGILLEESKTSNKRTPKIIEKLTELKTGEGTSKNVEDITKNLFSDVKTEKPEKPETRRTTKDTQKSPDSSPKYPSHFGVPDGQLYVCPSCETYKTKSVKDFIGHLHGEMNYYRCVCQLCDCRFVDMSQAKLHWLENHKTAGNEEKVTPLTPDGKVENWVDNCIRYQYKKMKKTDDFKDDSSVETVILENTVNISPKTSLTAELNLEIDVIGLDEPKTPKKTKPPQAEPPNTPEKTSPSKLQCQHCSFVAKTPQTYRKHTKRHFTFKPFKCNNCSFTTFSFISVQQHHRAKHKELELSYKEEPQPEGPLIRPLKRKRAQNDSENPVPAKILAKEDIKQETETSLTDQQREVVEEEVPTSSSEKTLELAAVPTAKNKKTLDTSSNEIESKEKSDFDIIYVCFHCPRKSEDLEVVRLHFVGSHDKIQKDSFKYKKITIDKNKKTQYKCNYCTWFGHPDGLKQHHLDNHSDKTWICQKAIKYKCANCKEIFTKIPVLKKHYANSHPNKNLCFQTVFEDNENESLDTTEIIEEPLDIKPDLKINKCEYCLDSFETADQLLSHHNLLHSHLALKAKTVEPQNLEEQKKYKCPQCGHTSNSYPAMRDHLRSHNKPYCCTYCSLYFSYPNQLKSHHLKEHRVLPLGEIKEQPEMKKSMDRLRENMLFLGPDGLYSTRNKASLKRANTETSDEPASKVLLLETSNFEVTSKKMNVARKSTSLPAFPKNVARKSTSNRPTKPEGYSFYGTKPCDINDFKNVMSEINIMGKIMPINVVAMSHVLNLFPTVPLTDCKRNATSQNL